MSNLRLRVSLGLLFLLLTACNTQYPETCPASHHIGLESADEIASDDSLPFRFPLDLSPFDEKIPLIAGSKRYNSINYG